MDRLTFAVDLRRRSRTPPDDFADDILVEMANLGESDTNVPGTIFVSTALGAHGPRVKWYPQAPGRTLPCVIMSISPEPEVRDDFLPPRVSGPVLPLLREWIKLNHADLRTFWDDGESWDRHRVTSFLDSLRPVPR